MSLVYVDKEMIVQSILPMKELSDDVTCLSSMTYIPALSSKKPIKDPSINAKLMKIKIKGKKPWSKEYLHFTWR